MVLELALGTVVVEGSTVLVVVAVVPGVREVVVVNDWFD